MVDKPLLKTYWNYKAGQPLWSVDPLNAKAAWYDKESHKHLSCLGSYYDWPSIIQVKCLTIEFHCLWTCHAYQLTNWPTDQLTNWLCLSESHACQRCTICNSVHDKLLMRASTVHVLEQLLLYTFIQVKLITECRRKQSFLLSMTDKLVVQGSMKFFCYIYRLQFHTHPHHCANWKASVYIYTETCIPQKKNTEWDK